MHGQRKRLNVEGISATLLDRAATDWGKLPIWVQPSLSFGVPIGDERTKLEMSPMTIEYAKAYGVERLAHAHMKRQQHQAVLVNRARRIPTNHPIGRAVRNLLTYINKHPSKISSPAPALRR